MVLLGGGALAILWVLALALLTWRVYADLDDVRSRSAGVKAALLQGDTETAQKELENARSAASEANTIASSFVWTIPAAIPLLGEPLATVEQMASVVNRMTGEVLPRAFDAVSLLADPGFRRPDGGVNLDVLQQAVGPATEAADRANAVKFASTQIEGSWLSPLDTATTELQSNVDELASMLEHVRKGAKVLPTVLGSEGPRTYLLIYQTNAEARGTGGFIGGAGLLRTDGGAVQVDHVGTNVSLRGEYPPLDLGPDFASLYGQFNASGNWYNSNMSAHFPYAAEIWQHLWLEKTGTRVDGVIAVDPFAMSRVLEVTGPLPLPDGTIINSANVVPITERTAYERFGNDVEGRKRFLTTIAETAAEAVTSKSGNTFAAIRAFSLSIAEGRASAWSTHPSEQTVIASTAMGHVVPYDRAPYANVIVNNAGGNKLDYYLSRRISYVGGMCDRAIERNTKVTAQFTNNAPVGTLPSYVLGADFGARDPYINHSIVTMYATSFARVNAVKVNGAPVPFEVRSEIGHPVVVLAVDFPPGIPTEITYELTEPMAQGPASVPVQPLVQPTEVSIAVPTCR